jgi:hypothetical protein
LGAGQAGCDVSLGLADQRQAVVGFGDYPTGKQMRRTGKLTGMQYRDAAA